MLGRKNNLHQQIKTKIVDKIFIYSKCANSTQRTPINREKLQKEINQDIIPFYHDRRGFSVGGTGACEADRTRV
jgi:hypothetical protein